MSIKLFNNTKRSQQSSPSDGPFFVVFWSRKHIQLGNSASMSFRHLRSGPSTVSCVLLRRTCLRRTPPHYSSPWLDGFLAVYVSRFSRNDDLIYGIALRVYCRLAEVPTSLFRVRVRLLSIISGRKNYPHQDESKWDENNLISHYKFTETRTKEFAPSTIIINFVETARFTKTLEACESSSPAGTKL